MRKTSKAIFNKMFEIFKIFYFKSHKDISLELQKRALKTTVDYIEKNMREVESVDNKFSLLEKALKEVKIDGMYLEFGVYKGETINHIASIKRDKKIYGFDSFEGLPKFWRDGFSKGAFHMDKLPKVKKNVVLLKGWFDKSLKEFLRENKEDCSFVHIDSDLYESAKTIFDFLDRRIRKGTIIVFDEFFNYPGWEEGEFKAFHEFIEKNKLDFKFISYNRNDEQVAVKIV